MGKRTSVGLVFKALEDSDIVEMHKRQNTDCTEELSELFDNKPMWSPLTLGQIKDKLAEEQKKTHTTVFSIYAGEKFVGIGEWSASWDTWAPYAWVIMWPEHRRKGYGTQAARMLLDKSFLHNPGHVTRAAAADWNMAAKEFLKFLGFKDAGRMRRVGMIDGQYFDILYFDILKSEYLGTKKGVRQ
jgi:RimJ/RimL family protein N-acetyltransferase